jgi:hypothetical protein
MVATAATVAVEQAAQATEQVVAMAGPHAKVGASAAHVAAAAAVAMTAQEAVAVSAAVVAAARLLAGRSTGRRGGAGGLASRRTGRRRTRLLTTLRLATTVAAIAIQAQHAIQELEAEALARKAYADYQRAEKHVPSHRATSPFTSRTSRFLAPQPRSRSRKFGRRAIARRPP